mgnify:CR=1 FL=1|tara:strand:+ start:208 stop:846 length:639 start_codon:yes stop_codon:yes gene_type:complete
MAANEHKNLTDINRHNPKGFENATNDTVLTKDTGTTPTGTDGNLVWQNKALMGVTNYKMQGYLTGALNYFYGEDIADTKSPFEMAVNYGSATVSGGSLLPSEFFRIGQGFSIPQVSSVTSVSGWITSNTASSVTIAICKITPVTGVTTAIVPVVIDEITVVGGASNNNVIRVNETTITTAALAEGDIIFPMIKEETAGSTIYMNLTIQTTTF